ncbi:MAG: nucleotidyltransferase family protein [Austwickia sp.]|nr:nucleotidyltransferase family protein [Austwickia sp.]
MADVTAVVLCGGRSRRFGGGDKTQAPLGGADVLARLLASLPTGWDVICVGPARPVPRPVRWVREEPPGGGPVAGIRAGLASMALETREAGVVGPATPYVVLLAGDLPFAGPAAAALVADLRAAPPEVDGVRALDEQGEAQALLAAYRTHRLLAAVPREARDLGVRRTLAGLTCRTRAVPAPAAWDVDTAADLDRAAQHLAAERP